MKKATVLLSLLMLLFLGWDSRVFSAAAVEKDNEAIAPGVASSDDDSADDVMTAEDSSKSTETVSKTTEYVPKPVKNGEVNFNYFLTSGYAADDINNIPAVAHVEGTPELDGSLSVAKSVYLVVVDDKVTLNPGTKLIAFGDGGPLVVKKADFNKRFIKNLAILRVREQAGKRRYLADVVNSFDFLPAGSPVKFYDGEKALWDKIQAPQTPSDKAIKCYVAGGERGRDAWNQTDYIILTAGRKQGVTEGTLFQLLEVTYNNDNQKERKSRGWAKVFYAGSSYCLAKIQSDASSIQAGFEAVYQP